MGLRKADVGGAMVATPAEGNRQLGVDTIGDWLQKNM
jgi:hypothetical protein